MESMGSDAELIEMFTRDLIDGKTMKGTKEQFQQMSVCFIKNVYGNLTLKELENASDNGS